MTANFQNFMAQSHYSSLMDCSFQCGYTGQKSSQQIQITSAILTQAPSTDNAEADTSGT